MARLKRFNEDRFPRNETARDDSGRIFWTTSRSRWEWTRLFVYFALSILRRRREGRALLMLRHRRNKEKRIVGLFRLVEKKIFRGNNFRSCLKRVHRGFLRDWVEFWNSYFEYNEIITIIFFPFYFNTNSSNLFLNFNNHFISKFSNTIPPRIFSIFKSLFPRLQLDFFFQTRGENRIFKTRRIHSSNDRTRGHRICPHINTLRNTMNGITVSVSNRVSRYRARIVIFGALGTAYISLQGRTTNPSSPPLPLSKSVAQSRLRISTMTGSNRLKSDGTSSARSSPWFLDSSNFRFFSIIDRFLRE